MEKVSALIITLNEEKHIEGCLQSIKEVADEIIVVDSFSIDKTEEICKKYNVRFVKNRFGGFREQKNFALSLASHRYILSIDADEVLSEPLQNYISELKQKITADGYLFNRLNNFCGQWIKHSGWYPDWQLRLFDKEKGKWGGFNVHERVELTPGSIIRNAKGDLLHWPYSSISDYDNKIEKYSDIAAFEYHVAGKKAGFLAPFTHMLWKFISTYIIRGGFLDGRNGYIICSSNSYYNFLKYKKLRKLNRSGASNYSTYNGL
jgi:glycosyltransferase involved in cell wall biosynthesis